MFRIATSQLFIFLLRGISVSLLALSLLGAASSALGQDLTVYFYSPEINTTRNVVLKNTFDQYLKEQGDYQFQPVDNRETFEALIKSDENAIFMMSSWHFEQLESQSLQAIPALRGIRKGSSIYRKILVGKKTGADLTAMTIATSGTLKYSRSILAGIYPNHSQESLDKPRFLIVPKDIDALMTVGFGLADAALATELSMGTLSTLYKNQHQQLHILGKSRPLKRLIVIHPQALLPRQRDAITALKNMSKNNKGLQALHILGLDGWQRLDGTLNTNGGPKQ